MLNQDTNEKFYRAEADLADAADRMAREARFGEPSDEQVRAELERRKQHEPQPTGRTES